MVPMLRHGIPHGAPRGTYLTPWGTYPIPREIPWGSMVCHGVGYAFRGEPWDPMGSEKYHMGSTGSGKYPTGPHGA